MENLISSCGPDLVLPHILKFLLSSESRPNSSPKLICQHYLKFSQFLRILLGVSFSNKEGGTYSLYDTHQATTPSNQGHLNLSWSLLQIPRTTASRTLTLEKNHDMTTKMGQVPSKKLGLFRGGSRILVRGAWRS